VHLQNCLVIPHQLSSLWSRKLRIRSVLQPTAIKYQGFGKFEIVSFFEIIKSATNICCIKDEDTAVSSSLENLVAPTQHGWNRLEDGSLKPIPTNLPPAPKAVIEMSLCRCKKSCDTKRCTCIKVGLVYTEMCFCESYKNEKDENECSEEKYDFYESSDDDDHY